MRKSYGFQLRFVLFSTFQVAVSRFFYVLPSPIAGRIDPPQGSSTRPFLAKSPCHPNRRNTYNVTSSTLSFRQEEDQSPRGESDSGSVVSWWSSPKACPTPFPCCPRPLNLSLSKRASKRQELLSPGKLRQEEGVSTNVWHVS